MSKDKLTLRGENLVKMYGKKRVVKDVSVQVEQGQIIGLLGPNGAGKTTTFYMIVGLVKPTTGRVYLDQEDITRNAGAKGNWIFGARSFCLQKAFRRR